MCIYCYKEMGSPFKIHQYTEKCVDILEGIHYAPEGDILHLIVDDFNLDRVDFDNDLSYHTDLDEWRELHDGIDRVECFYYMMSEMSEDERATVISLYEGWVMEPEVKE